MAADGLVFISRVDKAAAEDRQSFFSEYGESGPFPKLDGSRDKAFSI